MALNNEKKNMMNELALEKSMYYARRKSIVKDFLDKNINKLSVIDIQRLRSEVAICDRLCQNSAKLGTI